MDMKKISGIALATAAAGLLMSAPAFAVYTTDTGDTSMLNCYGVNSCKGKSACKTISGDKGQNSCKGKGFVVLSKTACEQLGGRLDPGTPTLNNPSPEPETTDSQTTQSAVNPSPDDATSTTTEDPEVPATTEIPGPATTHEESDMNRGPHGTTGAVDTNTPNSTVKTETSGDDE